MKKNKVDYLRIKVPIYHPIVHYIVTDNFVEVGKQFNLTYDREVDSYLGLCSNISSRRCIYIFIKEKYKNDWNTISHEVLHATLDILDDVGVDISNKNSEAITYLMGFLMGKIQTYTEKKIIK